MKWLIFAWTAFTTTLAIWWWVLGLRLMQNEFHRMFMYEGTVMVVLIIGGGIALAYSLYKTKKKSQQLREFFASFSHEIKTSLTNLRLQTELIIEEQKEKTPSLALNRLMQESNRLEIQLENSLALAQEDQLVLYPEDLPLKTFLQGVAESWPQLKLHCDMPEDLRLRADRRALEIIFRNIFQNAAIHGEAHTLAVSAYARGQRVELKISNDGKTFTGDLRKLGKMFARQGSSSSTGIGLALIKKLMRVMKGEAEFSVEPFSSNTKGLTIQLVFPQSLVTI